MNDAKMHKTNGVAKLEPYFSTSAITQAVVEDIEGDGGEVDLAALAKKALISPCIDYPKPVTVLNYSVDNLFYHLFTAGSISIGIGKAKGGKTSLSILFVAAVVMGYLLNPDDENQRLESSREGAVLYFDTEQGQYYGSLTLARIKSIVGDQAISRIRYYDLREYEPKLRLDIMTYVIENAGDIALIVLDGVRDIAYDINDSKEAVILVTKLMALSTIHNTHIFSILHQNKGDANARGHLGTELVNKSETVISINKHPDDDGISVVEAEYTRGLAFPAFAIKRDESGAPTIFRGIEGSSTGRGNRKTIPMPSDLSTVEVFGIVSDAFSNCSEDEVKTDEFLPELKNAIKRRLNVEIGKSKAEEWMAMLKNRRYIIHNGGSTNKSRYSQCTELTLINENSP